MKSVFYLSEINPIDHKTKLPKEFHLPHLLQATGQCVKPKKGYKKGFSLGYKSEKYFHFVMNVLKAEDREHKEIFMWTLSRESIIWVC